MDINKQPAFDHPALKNHKIQVSSSSSSFFYCYSSLTIYVYKLCLQLRPSSYPVGLFDDDISSSTNRTTSTVIGLPDGGCPLGTVPIRRLTKENLMRMKLSLKDMKIKNTPSMHNYTNEELHHQVKIIKKNLH